MPLLVPRRVRDRASTIALCARVDVRRPSLAALGELHDVIRDTEPAENALHEERLAPWGPGGSQVALPLAACNSSPETDSVPGDLNPNVSEDRVAAYVHAGAH